MKRILLLFLSLAVATLYGQDERVGINTATPKTTLDVSGKTDASNVSLTTDMTGLQAPRLTRSELTGKANIYGTDQKGVLIYITDYNNGTALGPRININKNGYYYFDGAVWVKLVIESENPTITANNGLTKTGENIKLGGTLLENTTIANAGFNTAITGAGNFGVGIYPPIEKLDVDGNVRFRQVPSAASLATTDQVMILASDGTAKKVALASLQPPDKFTLFETFEKVATVNVDKSISGIWAAGSAIDNVDLGISLPVTIPANTVAKLLVNYSIPMGIANVSSCADDKLTYYGIRFLKGAIEQPMGSRKFSFLNGTLAARMTTVSGIFVEEVTNNTASPITITYTLNGYLEIAGSTIGSPCAVRFNMWAASGSNFNWGRGAMTVQLFTKPL